jgi:hypothetical protein
MGNQGFAAVRELKVLKTDINVILGNAPFLFTSRPKVINIFHAKHISGGSQAIKVKVYSPSTNKHTPMASRIHGYRPYQQQSWGSFV